MKPKSPVQKNNLAFFHMNIPVCTPYRYTWYICIAMMKYTSFQEYLYPMILRKSILQTSLSSLWHTHARTHAIVKVYMGPRPCHIESSQIKGLSMKPACTCSTFHFNSSTLFAYEVICQGFVICWYFFFKISFFCCCCFFYFFPVISEECQAVWILIMPVGSDLGLNCLQRLSAGDTSK